MRKHVGGDWIDEGELLQFGPQGAIPSPKKEIKQLGGRGQLKVPAALKKIKTYIDKL